MPRCQRSSASAHTLTLILTLTLTVTLILILTLTLNLPAGTYNPNERATSIEACIVCEPGTFCPEES